MNRSEKHFLHLKIKISFPQLNPCTNKTPPRSYPETTASICFCVWLVTGRGGVCYKYVVR